MLNGNERTVACGLTLFNSTENDIRNVLYYTACFDRVFVYDNTENNYDYNELKNNHRIEILSRGVNNGLGVACNALCEAAKAQHYDYIILFDQDSRMDAAAIKILTSHAINDEKTAILCPKIVYNQEEPTVDDLEVTEVKWCITSGSCIRLSLYGVAFKFDENYFIDRLDIDCCKQVTNSGYRICQVNKAWLYQQLGEHYIGGLIPYATHGMIRHYYIARNRLYYNHKYGIVGLSGFQTAKQIALIFLYEKQKCAKIRMVGRGINDYFKHKMGKGIDL